MKELGKEIKRVTQDYYTCGRCKIDSNPTKEMCPCPRGGCEAKIAGTETTITYLSETLSKEQIDWNKKNHRE
jgi:hypothetical protein